MIDVSLLTTGARPINPLFYDISHDDILDKFEEWINSSKREITGLPKHRCLINGTTDAFNAFYLRFDKIGVFEAEYGYHRLSIPSRITTNLEEADAIIVSHPFSADGLSSYEKLKIADSYNVPILVDCAMFCISNIDVKLSEFKNIDSVAFSFSKAFGTGRKRSGILYSNNHPSIHQVYEKFLYVDIGNAVEHLPYLNKVSPDWTFEHYRNKQIEICKELSIEPSDTVIFGITSDPKWDKFKRGSINRICIAGLL